jgi:GH24 family phage-related lysozyme (muramidase)
MTALQFRLGIAIVGFTMATCALGQRPADPAVDGNPALPTASNPSIASDAPAIQVPTTPPTIQLLQDFSEADVKFNLQDLLEVLRDRRHEGWVLAAYPDPKTGQPLIGAGVSLDLPAREHPQRDHLNPNSFIEPSSAELWQASGLDPERLNRILAEFQRRLAVWNMREFRGRIRELDPQISDEEATQLLRTAAVQAILNARAYCRSFDQLTGPQQMALSQLVFQMGVNLEEFSQFLSLINSDSIAAPIAKKVAAGDVEYWTGVQKSLVQSQWARLYRTRAISVIAMLDPRYNQNPRMAERRVGATLRPAIVHRRRGRSSGSTQLASNSKSAGPHAGKRTRRSKRKSA